MLFNSTEFVLFLIVVLLVHHALLPPTWWRARKGWLVVTSYVFYMSWNPFFGLLLLGSTTVDFFVGLGLERARAPLARRALLLVSLGFNLGMLAWFKYGDFAARNLAWLLGWPAPAPFDVLLPVGISFYTFESLSYTIDVWRGQRACRRFLDFALFLSFFPHLVAGPIVRPWAFLPQLRRTPHVTGPEVEAALARIAQGMLKKVLLADVLGVYVDRVWGDVGWWPGANLLLAFYAYAFQIYFDFSGYTDIALGLAQLFGLVLPENFARPYLAADPREFWQRWHISLSTWLRDYLYIPLGGNRGSSVRTYVNLFLTMLLGGLWHGAAWSFVCWGGFHGAWLAVHRALRARRPSPLPAWLARLATFHLVVLGWVLFRAPSLADAGIALRGLLRPGMVWYREASEAAILVAVGVLLHLAPSAEAVRARFVRLPSGVQGAAYATAIVGAFCIAPASERFIYFQF